MFSLSEYKGAKISFDLDDADLCQVFSLLSDIAQKDGYIILGYQRIKSRIKIKMVDASWNQILIEILAVQNFRGMIENNKIMISLIESDSGIAI